MKNPKNVITKLFSADKGNFRPFIIVFLNKLNPKFCNEILQKIQTICEISDDKNGKSLDKIKKLLEVKTEIKEELVSELEKIEKNFESEKEFGYGDEVKENEKGNFEEENQEIQNHVVDHSMSEIGNKEKGEIEIYDENNINHQDNNKNDKEINDNNGDIDSNEIYSEKWCKIDKYNQFSSKGLILKSTIVKSKEELSEKIMLLIEYVVKMNNFSNNVNWSDINNVVEQDFLKYKF